MKVTIFKNFKLQNKLLIFVIAMNFSKTLTTSAYKKNWANLLCILNILKISNQPLN